MQKEDAATSTDESDFDHAITISQPNVRKNQHGQIKTSRNVKRPKPPLPPLKRTPKAPLRRSARNIAKIQPEVNFYMLLKVFGISILFCHYNWSYNIFSLYENILFLRLYN